MKQYNDTLFTTTVSTITYEKNYYILLAALESTEVSGIFSLIYRLHLD